jgi:hypothetical protein
MSNPTLQKTSSPASQKRPTAAAGKGAPSGQDKRNAPRLDVERAVQIIAGDAAPIPCSLSDVSRSGARLLVADPAALPDEFMLLFRDDLRKWCRVMRRDAKHIGIKFIAAPQTDAPPLAPG